MITSIGIGNLPPGFYFDGRECASVSGFFFIREKAKIEDGTSLSCPHNMKDRDQGMYDCVFDLQLDVIVRPAYY